MRDLPTSKTAPPPALRDARWEFPYLEACELLGDEPAATGDVLSLVFRGAFRRPELAAAGVGEPCIVTAISRAPGGVHLRAEVSLFR